jgi:hypothetical protein
VKWNKSASKKMLATLTEQDIVATIKYNIVQYQETGTGWVATLSVCTKTELKKILVEQ